MSSSNPSPAPTQAKITQKLIVRTAILLFAAAAIVFAFQYYRSVSGDLGGLTVSETTGMIAAIQYHEDGQEAVLIKPDGTVLHNDGWKPGVRDRDIAWSPDGNFLFFVSDREAETFQVMRWSPSSNKVESRTVGTRGRSNPTFSASNAAGTPNEALIVSGGFVLQLDPKDKSTRQVLPPLSNEIAQGGGDESGAQGSLGQFAGAYGRYGKAFKLARWTKGHDWIVATMDASEQQGSQGEVLVAQCMVPTPSGKFSPPLPLAAGDKIEFSVNEKTGGIVYAVTNFQWPDIDAVPKEFRVGNKITKPYRHVLSVFDPGDQATGAPSTSDLAKQANGNNVNGPIVASNDDKTAFSHPQVSPDGSAVIFSVGKYDTSGQFTPGVLISGEPKAGAVKTLHPILRGQIFEPSWSPNSSSIVFARHDKSGKRTLFVVDKDGGSERNLSGTQGDFGYPLYSPQTAK